MDGQRQPQFAVPSQFINQNQYQIPQNQGQFSFSAGQTQPGLVDPRINQNQTPQFSNQPSYSQMGVGSFQDMNNPMGGMGDVQFPVGSSSSPSSGGGGMFSQSSMFGGKDAQGMETQGWVSPALNFGMGAFNTYLASEQLGLAEDTLDFNKEAYAENLAQQKGDINRSLADRQRQRVAANEGQQSVDDYMKEYGV